MERKLATIQLIQEILPIEGADFIEKCRILGWVCIIKKNEFSLNEKICYIEVDSILPQDNPNFTFMEKYNYRVRSLKMKNTVSQGLVFPLSILPLDYQEAEIGTDITEVLGITKYEPPVKFVSGQAAGQFPHFIPKTDCERVQSNPELLGAITGKPSYITVKFDGTSWTCYNKDGEFGVCSRNLQLQRDPSSIYWKVVEKYNLENTLPPMGNYAIQGEIMGNDVQKNQLGFKEHDVFVFDVFDIDQQVYLGYNESRYFIEQLGMKTVPLFVENYIFNMTMEQLLEEADGYLPDMGTDKTRMGSWREGLIVRPMQETLITGSGRLSFKAISNKYLFKTGE